MSLLPRTTLHSDSEQLDGANMYYVGLRKRETTANKLLFQIWLPVLKTTEDA